MQPSDDPGLAKMVAQGDRRARKGRVERLRFLLSVEDDSLVPWPSLAHEYYEEARLCWFLGAFVAAILMTQAAFEELLRSQYRIASGASDKLDTGKPFCRAGFSDLICQAEADAWLSEHEAKALHRLRRELRNPYAHASDSRPGPEPPDGWFAQCLKIATPELIGTGACSEAQEAIAVMARLAPALCRRFWGCAENGPGTDPPA